jgi:protein-S-isoprenylcysteine O-methyltransferase Ste14
MIWLVRQLFAIAVLPFTVAVLIPRSIAQRNAITFHLASNGSEWLQQIGGACVLAVGAVLFVASLRRFITEGRGTLAPWDPPRRLVVSGPYRYVRNPMISGVVFVLFGEALVLRSRPHFVWALLFFAINCVYIPLLEEPMLADRFGADYRTYCRHVPRLIPRLRPWIPPAAAPADAGAAARGHDREGHRS